MLNELIHHSAFIIHHLLTKFLHALLTCNGLARSLSRAGVRSRALTSHGQRAAMTIAAIAADVAQSRDVLLDRATQCAFDQHLLVEQADDRGQLFFGKLFGATLGVD